MMPYDFADVFCFMDETSIAGNNCPANNYRDYFEKNLVG
jgi:hypothetical protein